MIQGRVINIPRHPHEIYTKARDLCFAFWVDEKGTQKNPSLLKRERSDLSFEKALQIISKTNPHWTILYRNMEYLTQDEKNYWEFGAANINSKPYGNFYIYIKVDVEDAERLFDEYGLKVDWY